MPGARVAESAAGRYESQHFADNLKQIDPRIKFEKELPLEKDFEQPPEDLSQRPPIIAVNRIVFRPGVRRVEGSINLKVPRRKTVVLIQEEGDIENHIVAKGTTSGAFSWLSGAVRTVSVKEARMEGNETSFQKKARNAARHKRKIRLGG